MIEMGHKRDRLVSLLLEAHRKEPLDGIALFLHGAGVAEGYDDLEQFMNQKEAERKAKEAEKAAEQAAASEEIDEEEND